jgi:hypothetical protein
MTNLPDPSDLQWYNATIQYPLSRLSGQLLPERELHSADSSGTSLLDPINLMGKNPVKIYWHFTSPPAPP